MNQLFTLIAVLLTSASAFSQTASAVVFSENGDKFTLLLNGEKKNDSPSVNVKVSGLTAEFYQARVDFEDAKLSDFSTNNFAVQRDIEVTYIIKVNKKGEYVLRYASEAPLSVATAASAPAENTDVKRYAVVDDEETTTIKATSTTTSTPGNVSMNTNVTGTGVNQSVVVTETTTTTAKPTNGENVGINMNVGGINMRMNVNMTGMDVDSEENSSTTVTTTTTTKTSSTAQPAPVVVNQPREEIVVQKGCAVAMDKSSFDRAKQSVSDKGFDETRLTTAKQISKSNCMNTAQIVDIMSVFGFEETKLEFAKYAYDYCVDQNTYYSVGDAFSFSDSVEELSRYIDSK